MLWTAHTLSSCPRNFLPFCIFRASHGITILTLRRLSAAFLVRFPVPEPFYAAATRGFAKWGANTK